MRWARLVRPLLLPVLVATPAAAQSYWHDDQGRFQVRLELLKPFLDNFPESFSSMGGFLSASGRLGSAFRVEADIPFARFASDDADVSAIRGGNPYLGFVYHRDRSRLAARFGIRFPLTTAPDDFVAFLADDVGRAGDFDRFEAFLPEAMTMRGAVQWRWDQADGTIVGLGVGPTLLFDTGDTADDVELYTDYGVRIGYQGAGIPGTLAFTGRMLVTDDDLNFADRTQHNLTGTLSLRNGVVRPGITLRTPLDPSVRDAVGAVLGVDLRVVF